MIGLGTIINTTAIVLGGIIGHLCFLFNVSFGLIALTSNIEFLWYMHFVLVIFAIIVKIWNRVVTVWYHGQDI